MIFWIRILIFAAALALVKWTVALELLTALNAGNRWQSDRFFILGLMALLGVLDALLPMITPAQWYKKKYQIDDGWPMIVLWFFSTAAPLTAFSLCYLNNAYTNAIWYGGTLVPGLLAATVSGLLTWGLLYCKRQIDHRLFQTKPNRRTRFR